MNSKSSFSRRTWLLLFEKTKTSFKRTPIFSPENPNSAPLPSHVRYERDEKGFVAAAVFLFPRKTEWGVPTISPDEKTIEFTCKIEGSPPRVAFELQKMVDQNGPAL